MLKRMALFMPPQNQYQVLHHFTRSLSDALSRTGIDTQLLSAEYDQSSAIEALRDGKPDCTLAFNGPLPDDQGFLCDRVQIPHVSCLVDAPHTYIPLIRSALSIVTCADRFHCDFLEGFNFHQVLFMPHAVDQAAIVPPHAQTNRPYDLLLLASFIDCDAIRKKWKKNYSAAMRKVLEEAAEISLTERNIPCVQALAQALDHYAKTVDGLDPTKIDFVVLLDELENYIKGKDRLALVQSITEVPLHIVGTESDAWKKYLGKAKNITVAPSVSYEDALHLMRQSKIVLNSTPTKKNGAHERIFGGVASGAAVITNDNLYMRENFKNGEEMLFYRYGNWDEMNQLIDHYLHDAPARLELVNKGQVIIKDKHTWDHRAATLVSELTPLLSRIRG